jgi:hypothetical protein
MLALSTKVDITIFRRLALAYCRTSSQRLTRARYFDDTVCSARHFGAMRNADARNIQSAQTGIYQALVFSVQVRPE